MTGKRELDGRGWGLRRDLPAVMAWTWRGNTPVGAQIVGSALSVVLILANNSRATASLFTFIILMSTAAVLVVYLAGALSAWRMSPAPLARAAISGALLFILFAFYGRGPRLACGVSSSLQLASPFE